MPIRITNLRMPIEASQDFLDERLADALDVLPRDISSWRLLRKSLDVRDKRAIRFVYSAEVRLRADEAPVVERTRARGLVQAEVWEEPPFSMPTPGSQPLRHRPVIIGSGPGGLVAGYFLAQQGYRPIVLERGTSVSQRIRDVKAFDAGGAFEPESNYLYGEGGAGTFSDGKLTCRGSGPDVQRILELFAECKGKPEILYEHRPHLGSNRLPAVVKAIRQRIEKMGGEVRFLTRVEDIRLSEGRLQSVETSSGSIPADLIACAAGHSARDMYEILLARGIPMAQKPFQMGVRVEHPQELVNRVQYGNKPHETILGNADYSMVAHGGADLFTFCMCAGGYIIPSVSQEGYFCTNGMSLSKRDSPSANSGLVVTLPLSEFGSSDILAGVRIQQQYEKRAYELGRGEYRCPTQRARDFIAGRKTHDAKSSYPRESMSADLREVLPPYIAKAIADGLPRMDRTWKGRFLDEAVLVGPESRGSSPIRMIRDDITRQSPGIEGFYPVGEGAGYAGGIVSAAVDGLKTARAIVARYQPLT